MNRNEAFARTLIDAQLADQGWNNDDVSIRHEYTMDANRADYLLRGSIARCVAGSPSCCSPSCRSSSAGQQSASIASMRQAPLPSTSAITITSTRPIPVTVTKLIPRRQAGSTMTVVPAMLDALRRSLMKSGFQLPRMRRQSSMIIVTAWTLPRITCPIARTGRPSPDRRGGYLIAPRIPRVT